MIPHINTVTPEQEIFNFKVLLASFPGSYPEEQGENVVKSGECSVHYTSILLSVGVSDQCTESAGSERPRLH